MKEFTFTPDEIAIRLESNEEDLERAALCQDRIMEAELYKQRGLLYLEVIKVYYSDEKSRLASQFFSEAIALNAEARITAFCLSKRASLNLAQGKVDACISDFIAACTLIKNDAQIWFEYGEVLVDLKRFEAALVPLKEALILRPQNPRIHNLIRTIISSATVSDNCLDDIKALMAVGRTLNTGTQKGSDLHLWLQVVQAGDKNFMSYLASQVNTRMHDGRGNTALHYAARFGHVGLIELLVKEYRIDPNAENRDGLTPLMIALHSGSVALIQALVDAGAKYSGSQWPLVAFENFPLPNANVFPMTKIKETKESTGLQRTTSFRVFGKD